MPDHHMFFVPDAYTKMPHVCYPDPEKEYKKAKQFLPQYVRPSRVKQK